MLQKIHMFNFASRDSSDSWVWEGQPWKITRLECCVLLVEPQPKSWKPNFQPQPTLTLLPLKANPKHMKLAHPMERREQTSVQIFTRLQPFSSSKLVIPGTKQHDVASRNGQTSNFKRWQHASAAFASAAFASAAFAVAFA